MSQHTSNDDFENILTWLFIFFMVPIGAIGAWMSGLLEAAKKLVPIIRHLLTSHPHDGRHYRRGGSHRNSIKHTGRIQHPRTGYRTGYPTHHLLAVPACFAADLR